VTLVRGFRRLQAADTFKRDYKKLEPGHKKAVEDCIRDLQADFIPAQRRWHRVDRNQRPPVFTVDVYPNKSWKLSCHVEDTEDGPLLVLRRVAPHNVIDRSS
jgi:uncharacterized protein YdeI (YjbR/CyaY-like superfamily)